LTVLLRRIKAAASFDLEACEFSIRDAVMGLGAGFLEGPLNKVGRGRRAEEVHCPRCARVIASVGIKYKTLRSILGRVRFGRSLFVCAHCGAFRFPADEELGIENTTFTPGAQRMMAKAASRSTFVEAAEDLALYANLKVTPKTVERCAQSIGREIEAWMKRQDADLLRDAKRVRNARRSGQRCGRPLHRVRRHWRSYPASRTPRPKRQIARRDRTYPRGQVGMRLYTDRL